MIGVVQPGIVNPSASENKRGMQDTPDLPAILPKCHSLFSVARGTLADQAWLALFTHRQSLEQEEMQAANHF